MASPTGASDSILILRRNEASVERYHGHLAPHLQNFQMETNGNRIKKSWGDRWNVNKTGKIPIDGHALDSSNFTIHPDYLNRYGTLSGGALTKSVKCAENTWLYGTMGFRSPSSQRPSLFLYPGVVFPPPRLANRSNYFNSPTTFLSMPFSSFPSADHPGLIHSPPSPPSSPPTSSSSPSPSLLLSTSSPRKALDNCFGKNLSDSGGNCSNGRKVNERKSGGSILNTFVKERSFSKDTTSTREKINSSSPTDPYNYMRKSRLGAVEVSDPLIFGIDRGRNRRRNANVLPIKMQPREAADSNFDKPKPGSVRRDFRTWKNDEEEVKRRKSILECDVNVYELNKTTSKEFDDFSDESAVKTFKCHSKKTMNSRPKLNKTDDLNATERKSQVAETKVQSTNMKNSEVRLNGQRFKIFDDSGRSSGSVEGIVGDEEDSKLFLEPTGALPKRPPRKSKEKFLVESKLKQTRLRSKSSPNLSIKSILKKKSAGSEENGLWLLLSSPLDREKSSSAVSSTVEKDDSPTRSVHQVQSRNSNLNTLKKKKQVQFRVNNSNEYLENPIGSESTEKIEKTLNFQKSKETEIDEDDENEENDSVRRSKSCENLIPLWEKDDSVSSGFNDEKIKRKLEGNLEKTKESFSNVELEFRRSYSDRRLTSALILSGNNYLLESVAPSKNTNLFNDTMAIRNRSTKLNARKTFHKTADFDSKKQSVQTKSENKNILEKTSKNLSEKVTNDAGLSKISESCDEKKESPPLNIANKNPKETTKSCLPVKTNSPSPSPPPRRPSTDKFRRDGLKTASKTPGKQANQVGSLQEETKLDALRQDSEKVSAADTIDSDWESASREGHKVQCETKKLDRKTIVRLGSNEFENVDSKGGKAFITIQSKDDEKSTEDEPQRKTSVIISNFRAKDSNKVTISVRNESAYDEMNSSTCTIIETGSNSTVIPVVSTDNKTTLIVGNNASVGALNLDENKIHSTPFNSTPDSRDVEKPQRYVFETVQEETNETIDSLDPVEAIRRNLIPHICGKPNEISDLKFLKNFDDTEKKASNLTIKKESEGKINEAVEFSSAAEKERRGFKSEDFSTATSRSNSSCSMVSGSADDDAGNDSKNCFCRNVSTSSVDSASKLYIPFDKENLSEQRKNEVMRECKIRNESKNGEENCENFYETIKESRCDKEDVGSDEEEVIEPQEIRSRNLKNQPIDAEESELQRSTAKSIFEGASKYEILNYLADAKERVEEDFYLTEGLATDVTNFTNLESSKKYDEKISPKTSSQLTTPPNLETTIGCSSRKNSVKNDAESDSASSISRQSSYLNYDNSTTETLPKNLTKKSSAEIERNDSGVGSETSHTSRSRWQVSSSIREDPQHLCEDCDQMIETQITEGGIMYVPLVCRKCSKKRSERKEIIQEIVETEEKYGRDLKIILEEFYTPMLVAGLLTPDQLSSIFLNTEELLENSELLTERLRDSLEIAADQGDEDLLTVNVGKLFLEAESMLHAFESYCVRQGAAAMLLASLEKEKELLRIFLRVSQMENVVLRRMNLNSFLMVPVQRVTKYPLLLARLYKVTPLQQEGRELLKEAQHTIELHLEHMNSEAKDVSATKVWRRFSTSAVGGRKSNAESEMINIKLRKMAVDVLEWNHEEVRFILEGKLLYTQPTDNNWKRGRTIKLSPIFVLLVTLGKPNSKYKMEPAEDELTFPAKTGIREATLLLVKEKCGRYTLIREPLYLDKIIVCCEAELDEYFEVQELLTKESFIFKAEDGEKTKEWYKQLQYHAQILGAWRKRRNALANIMINGMLTRTCTG